MRFAYADPPYLGQGKRLYGEHPDAQAFDTLEGHERLIGSLADYDAWAMSLSSTSLRDILPLCPEDCRLAAWVKPFAVFKPGVNPAYAWEPVVFRGGRKRSREEETVRDWTSASITLRRGTVGAKPEEFCCWIFDLLGARPDDEFSDIFPGSGAVTKAWEWYRRQLVLPA